MPNKPEPPIPLKDLAFIYPPRVPRIPKVTRTVKLTTVDKFVLLLDHVTIVTVDNLKQPLITHLRLKNKFSYSFF